ncbi:MAG: NAD(P)-dependent alcohol dehydrogenase [Bacteroidia bacterium]|nr:NAD(P)-dependent alcohol dehydrogenase [Bacteroidia bacterium]
MKAAVNTQYGPPEVVSIQEIPIPIPNPNQILIKVHYATVNRTDCGFRSAEYFISRFFSGLLKPHFNTLGCEFSGTIISLGKQVTQFNVGDRIFGFNDKHFGAHAEYQLLNMNDPIGIIPDEVNFETAACLCEGGHYALSDIKAVKIKKGDKVLINGATGAIGSAAIQICVHLGADVTAVCATENISLIESLHPAKIIDYKKEDFTQTNDKYDWIFDAVGKSSFGKCKNILNQNGIYISTELGPYWENPLRALFISPFSKKKVLFPIPSIKTEDINYLLHLHLNGHYNPLIDRIYELDQIVEAYHYVESGFKNGNVLLRIS